MKKVKYLFMSLLVGTFGMTMVEAKQNPTFTTSLGVTKVTGSDTINIEAVVKNSGDFCDGVGLKSGEVYIYLDENLVKRATNITGIYKDYNENTQSFSSKNVICSYDGENHRVGCIFGKNISSPALIAYSDCKDELVVTFETELCAGSEDCNIRVEVEGQSVDYNNGSPIAISSGVEVMSSKNFDCNSTLTNTPTQTPQEPDDEPTVDIPNNEPEYPSYEPEENPNTIDNGTLYMLIATLSLVLIVTTINVKKKKEA